jgi:AcrR family transcriptional regulator
VSSQESFERVAQKRRTRQALLVATRELLDEGKQPTVPEAADRAGISRATAYRYFSTPMGMAEEAILDALAVEFEKLDLDRAYEKEDAVSRAVETVSAILRMVMSSERLFRTYLGLVVNPESGVRRGARRVSWLTRALEPLAGTLAPDEFRRIVHGLALLTGMETIVVLRDVCGLEDADIDETARWLAARIVGQTR